MRSAECGVRSIGKVERERIIAGATKTKYKQTKSSKKKYLVKRFQQVNKERERRKREKKKTFFCSNTMPIVIGKKWRVNSLKEKLSACLFVCLVS